MNEKTTRELKGALSAYLLELSGTLPACEQVRAWGFGALNFARQAGIITRDECETMLLEFCAAEEGGSDGKEQGSEADAGAEEAHDNGRADCE